MEKITIEDIIEFVRKAMHNNLRIYNSAVIGERSVNFDYRIHNNEEFIYIEVMSETITISDNKGGGFRIKYILDDRERLELETLNLDIKEYKANRALYNFKNFFTEAATLKDINNLDDDD